MLKEQFKEYLSSLIEEHNFERLMYVNAFDDNETKNYLESRGLSKEVFDFCDIEVFSYDGTFKYKNKEYNIKKSIVIPLKSLTNELIGVWIRSIYEKRFYIWLIGNNQKYWLSGKFNPSETPTFCESILDALSFAYLTKNPNVGAFLGVSPTNDLLNIVNDINLALDDDQAGKKNSLELLISYPNWTIISSNLEGFKDYNEFLKSKKSLNYEILKGINAKIKLRSII